MLLRAAHTRLKCPTFSFPHSLSSRTPLPVLIYSHAESRDRQIETRRNGRQVLKEEVIGEVEMAVCDVPLVVNWVWTSNQRVNRLFITSEVEYFKFACCCCCSGISMEHTSLRCMHVGKWSEETRLRCVLTPRVNNGSRLANYETIT